MDFYYKKTFVPNPVAMKVSSFHKQQGHIVNFVENEFEINLSFDLYYIFRELEKTPRAPGHLVDNKNSRLIGRPMRFFDNYWEPNEIIAAVRPDYLLYPEKNERAAYYNAEVVQFYHKGKRLPILQPFGNTARFHRKTLVIDKEKDFWEASTKDMLEVLEELSQYKNIAFTEPISLKRIMENKKVRELFVNLH